MLTTHVLFAHSRNQSKSSWVPIARNSIGVSPAVVPTVCVSVRYTTRRKVRSIWFYERRPASSLTEFEESIPGPAELPPGFGDERAQPPGDGTGVHGRLERAEHEPQGLDVVHGRLRDAVLQAAQTTLVKNGGHACAGERLHPFFFFF